jgi:hypothetical protein
MAFISFIALVDTAFFSDLADNFAGYVIPFPYFAHI